MKTPFANPILWIDQEFCGTLAWTLFHFVWQGAILAVAVMISSRWLAKVRSDLRYQINLASLAAMLCCIPVTFTILQRTKGTHLASHLGPTSNHSEKQPPHRVGLHAVAVEFVDDQTMEDDGKQSDSVAGAQMEPIRSSQTSKADGATGRSGSTQDERISSAKPQSRERLSLQIWEAPLQKVLPTATTIAYLAGVGIMLLRLGVAIWSGYRLQRHCHAIDDETLHRILIDQSRRVGLRSPPLLRYCQSVAFPAVVGVFRPMVLMPATLASGLTPEQLESIFLHELAHIRRLDPLVNLFQRMTEAILFFHPAVWYVSRRVSIERENCCDDLVVVSGHDRLRYAQALVRMAEICLGASATDAGPRSLALSASGENATELKKRVLRLIDAQPQMHLTRRGSMLACVFLLALVLSPVSYHGLMRSTIAAPLPQQIPAVQATDDGQDTEETLKTKRSEIEVLQDRRTILRELEDPLEAQEFETVIAKFTTELRREATMQKLQATWKKLLSQRGPMRRVDAKTTQQVGVSTLYLIHLEWKRSYLDLRVDFDDDDRIAGLWIDTPLDSESDFFPTGGIQFGDRIREIAGRRSKLRVTAVDADGDRVDSVTVAFYRELSENETPAKKDWQEPGGSSVWRRFWYGSDHDSVTAKGLTAGWYRVLVGEESTTSGPLTFSGRIRIDRDVELTEYTAKLGPTASTRITAENEDGEPLRDVRVSLEMIRPSWPQLQINPSNRDGGLTTFDRLPAGKYRVIAYQRAARWDGERYDVPAKAAALELKAGETAEHRIRMVARKLTEKEIDQRAPWVAKGRVTDPSGKPIAGVAIWASAGWGSMRSVEIATTNEQGEYFGRFSSSGIQMMSNSDSIGVVSAQVGAHKTGFAEANLNRHGGLRAANRLPRPNEEVPEGVDPNRLFTPGQPVHIDFVLKPAATVTVTLLNREGEPLRESKIWLDGDKLPPASSVMASGKTDEDGQFKFESVPTGFDWWFEVDLGDRKYASSKSFLFGPSSYHLELKQTSEKLTGKEIFTLTSARHGDRKDATADIAREHPSQHAPLDEQSQAKGRGLLKKLRETNKFWLGETPGSVQDYTYDFQLQDNPVQQVASGSGSIYKRRGISYYSALDHLTRSPEQVIFRSIESEGDRTKLFYTFRERIRVSAGNGVSGTWRGYFSRPATDGMLVIDTNKFVPIEHKTKGMTETFSNYVLVDPGHHVPLRIQIDKMNLDWRFKLHLGRLWLFDRNTPTTPDQPPIAKVTNVVINGKPIDDERTLSEP